MLQEHPKHVAIVALGPSSLGYIKLAEGLGGRSALVDEVWAVNSFGDVIAHDRLFHMDDVRIQEIRAQAKPDGKIAKMLRWMKTHPGPIYTSRSHPDYPGLVEFPLEEVVNATGSIYFNSTPAYAIAYAIYLGVEQLSLFGVDYTYPNAHEAERGRACCEFWLGRAMQRGMQIRIADTSTLMDSNEPFTSKLYGYDTLDVNVGINGGRVHIGFNPRAELPSAQQIEDRYDHSKHPANLPAPQVNISGLFGREALERFLLYDNIKTVLDIGSGEGIHAEIMRKAGLDVCTISMVPPADLVGNYLRHTFYKHFDAIWACHVLEHMPDPGEFLRKCFRDLKNNGVLAVTVPPMKSELVGGHLTLWTPALLVYHLILAGFDCSEARISPVYANAPDQPPYNISVIVRKKKAVLPKLEYDRGDIEKLAHLFPWPVKQNDNGWLPEVNWAILEYTKGIEGQE